MTINPKLYELMTVKQQKPEIIDEVEATESFCVGGNTKEEKEVKPILMGSGDVMMFDGKEVDPLGNVSDAAIEAAFAGASPAGSYKGLASYVITAIKQKIYELHHPTTPPGGGGGGGEEGGEEGGETPSTGDEGETRGIPTAVNHTLSRKGGIGGAGTTTKTITVNSTETVVKLDNLAQGGVLYYTLSSVDGDPHSVKLTILDNGRLVIQGDGIKIVATENQNDDIVLIGDECQVYTNSGDDIVRVGTIVDSSEENYKRTKTYLDDDGIEFEKDTTQSDNNYIHTGSGDDYVQIFGGYSEIVGGDGNDKLLVTGIPLTKMTAFKIITDGFEYTRSDREIITSSLNGKIEGGGQGGYGDCKFLSTLNSIADKFSDYVKIVKSGSNYKVTFLKSSKTVTVSASDLAVADNATGDIDFVLTEIAFRKLIEADGYNMDNNSTGNPSHDNKMLGLSTNNFLISKYLFNNNTTGATCSSFGTASSVDCVATYLLEELLAGKISNFVVGSNDGNNPDPARPNNPDLGIYYNHAYAVKGGSVGSYVEICNPWDGNDIIRLDWDDFLLYFDSINLFGDTYDSFYSVFTMSSSSIGDMPETISLGDEVVEAVDSYAYDNIFAQDELAKKQIVK